MVVLHGVCVSPKVWKTFPNGSHNDTWIETGYFDSMMDFINKVAHGEPVTETDSL
jgi:hypothetical protein